MAELTPQERLQPSLLDRLTDDRPQETRESRERRVLSMRQLRASVMRDLDRGEAETIALLHLPVTLGRCRQAVPGYNLER